MCIRDRGIYRYTESFPFFSGPGPTPQLTWPSPWADQFIVAGGQRCMDCDLHFTAIPYYIAIIGLWFFRSNNINIATPGNKPWPSSSKTHISTRESHTVVNLFIVDFSVSYS